MPGKEVKGRSKIAKYNKGGRVKLNTGGYIGKYIKGDLGGQKVSNPSYAKSDRYLEQVYPLVIVYELQKNLQNNLQRIGDTMISGGVDNMEKYQYMLGQARAYQYALQEISNLLKAKEQKNEQGNVIDLGKGNSKT